MISLSVNPGYETSIDAVLNGIKDKIDSKGILDDALAAMFHRNQARYLAERNPDNVPWIPSKAGIKRKAKGGTGTLFRSGVMFHSIQPHNDGPEDRSISTDVHYAKYALTKEPMRPFLGFNQEDMTVYVRIVIDSLKSSGLAE